MSGLSLILQCTLAFVLVLLACLSAQLAGLTILRFVRRPRALRMPLLPEEALPRVLVQLPVCDEGGLALRVVAAAAKLDWPSDRLEIQLLDDGPTYKHEALVKAVAEMVPEGISVSVLHRGERVGFKAGNLAFGLKHSNAPYVAIFDADLCRRPISCAARFPRSSPTPAFASCRRAGAMRIASPTG